jgi:hypothetical protein
MVTTFFSDSFMPILTEENVKIVYSEISSNPIRDYSLCLYVNITDKQITTTRYLFIDTRVVDVRSDIHELIAYPKRRRSNQFSK